jgi:ribosomal protein S27AE
VREYGEGRVCTEPGCETVLSVYNPSSRCAVHQRREDVVPLRRLESFEVERSCVQCGAPFLATNPRRKYCSSRCRSHAFAGREKLARLAARARETCERAAA